MAEQQNLAFSVDSHLLRELGALLVGRDSTALLELIKNSYDADATRVVVEASDLRDGNGYFTVVDDGNGMTLRTFKDAFLRIAGRSKAGSNRRSPRYRRRYTGAKGIGRLSAHKLASTLEVTSIPIRELLTEAAEDSVGVSAKLEWDQVENSTADLTDTSAALTASPVSLTGGVERGTSMHLTGIRGVWDARRIGPFLDEIRACRPASLLIEPLSPAVVDAPLLFETPVIREHASEDPGFTLELGGELAGSDELWQSLGEKTSWLLEIDAASSGVRYGVSPTARTVRNAKWPVQAGWFSAQEYQMSHPAPNDGPFFQARIFVREGSMGAGRGALARFERRESGIRIFLEGFRVVPYGAPGDDWLGLDQDYVRKRREFPNEFETDLPTVENEGFVQLGNRSYYGGVFLTEGGAPNLQAVVNREGFVPDAYFKSLVDLVRTGIDLVTRSRAAISRREKEEKDAHFARARAAEIEAAAESVRKSELDTAYPDPAAPAGPGGSALRHGVGADDSTAEADGEPVSAHEDGLRQLVRSVTSLAADVRADVLLPSAAPALNLLRAQLAELQTRLQTMEDEQVRLRTLATVGTQFSSFIHEINGLLGQAETLQHVVEEFPEQHSLSRDQRRALRLVRESTDSLAQTLTRQASYLTDVLSADARRRRRRLPVATRVQGALRLLLPRIAEREQQVQTVIPAGLHTPPLFPAELTIVITNLVSNATKFAGDGGRIMIAAELDDAMTLHLRVANTGSPVNESDWDRFFRPFESTSTDVDIVLGQGMGLGLPIVRSIAEDYNGSAKFVHPSAGYATELEVTFPDPRPSKSKRK